MCLLVRPINTTNKICLNYSRVKIAAAARQWLMSRICILRLGCNDADVVRLARP